MAKQFFNLILIILLCTACTNSKLSNKNNDSIPTVQQWEILNKEGIEFYKKGNVKKAQQYIKKSLDIAKKTFGKDSLETATSLNNLAEISRTNGDLPRAEKEYKASLEIRSKKLGKNDPITITTINNLAAIYFALGKYNQSEKLFKDTIASLEITLKDEDPTLMLLLSNLAQLYRYEKKYLESEAIYKRLLNATQNMTTGKDLVYASVLNDLGAIYFLQGKFNEAKECFETSVPILEEKLGENNAQLDIIYENLTQVYNKLGNKDKASYFNNKLMSMPL